jgi:hypothetical protein
VRDEASKFLDNRLTDGGEVFSPKCRLTFTPRKIPGIHFCDSLSRRQGPNAAGRITLIENLNKVTGNWSCDLPACSIVSQSTALPSVPYMCYIYMYVQRERERERERERANVPRYCAIHLNIVLSNSSECPIYLLYIHLSTKRERERESARAKILRHPFEYITYYQIHLTLSWVKFCLCLTRADRQMLSNPYSDRLQKNKFCAVRIKRKRVKIKEIYSSLISVPRTQLETSSLLLDLFNDVKSVQLIYLSSYS